MDSPFFSTVSGLLTGILNTGGFLFRSLFYSIEDWLNLYPDNGLFGFLGDIADLAGLDWLVSLSLVEFIFSPVGIWTILTVLLTYFMIP